MQPKKKIRGGGFQLKESGIKYPLVSVAVFSASHTHACPCVCSYACWTQRVFPHSPQKFSVKVCADAWICLCESKFAAWITVLFGNNTAVVSTSENSLLHSASLLLMFGFAWLTKADLPRWEGPLSWAALSVQSEHSPAELVPSSGFASVLSLLLAQKGSFSPGTSCRRTGHKMQRYSREFHRNTGDGIQWWPLQINS